MSRFNGETGESQELGVMSLNVVYNRAIDGIKITGKGQKLFVQLEEYGIRDCYKTWPELSPDKSMLLKNTDKALAQLKQGKYSYHNALDGTTRVVICNASIVYWADYTEYVVPVYEFKGKSLDANNKEISDYTAWVEALDI